MRPFIIFYLFLSFTLISVYGNEPVVGSKSIDFTLKNFQGKNVSLSHYKGKVVLLDFWASWCVPCKVELPLLNSLQKKYGESGLIVIAINIDNKAKNAIDFLDQHNIKLTCTWDKEKKVVSAYDVETMPTSILIDKKSKIRFIHTGFEKDDIKKYVKEINTLLKE